MTSHKQYLTYNDFRVHPASDMDSISYAVRSFTPSRINMDAIPPLPLKHKSIIGKSRCISMPVNYKAHYVAKDLPSVPPYLSNQSDSSYNSSSSNEFFPTTPPGEAKSYANRNQALAATVDKLNGTRFTRDIEEQPKLPTGSLRATQTTTRTPAKTTKTVKTTKTATTTKATKTAKTPKTGKTSSTATKKTARKVSTPQNGSLTAEKDTKTTKNSTAPAKTTKKPTTRSEKQSDTSTRMLSISRRKISIKRKDHRFFSVPVFSLSKPLPDISPEVIQESKTTKNEKSKNSKKASYMEPIPFPETNISNAQTKINSKSKKLDDAIQKQRHTQIYPKFPAPSQLSRMDHQLNNQSRQADMKMAYDANPRYDRVIVVDNGVPPPIPKHKVFDEEIYSPNQTAHDAKGSITNTIDNSNDYSVVRCGGVDFDGNYDSQNSNNYKNAYNYKRPNKQVKCHKNTESYNSDKDDEFSYTRGSISEASNLSANSNATVSSNSSSGSGPTNPKSLPHETRPVVQNIYMKPKEYLLAPQNSTSISGHINNSKSHSIDFLKRHLSGELRSCAVLYPTEIKEMQHKRLSSNSFPANSHITQEREKTHNYGEREIFTGNDYKQFEKYKHDYYEPGSSDPVQSNGSYNHYNINSIERVKSVKKLQERNYLNKDCELSRFKTYKTIIDDEEEFDYLQVVNNYF